MTIEDYLKKKKNNSDVKKNYNYLFKIMITILITIICLITLKADPNLKAPFYKYVFSDHISFVQINELYKKYLKNVLPFEYINTKPVFDEKLVYSDISKYKDGTKLTVTSSYLVPILENGMVVYIGDKEDYGTTVIIEQVDGIEVWYANLKNYNVKLYDYVEKGSLLGEVDNELYIVMKKNGEFINYEDTI